MEAEFDRAGEAVRTQEHQWSIIIDKDPRRRGGTRYYVLVDGRKEVLDYAGVLPDKSLYAPVWYVVDPEEESHLIAVGSPGDWEDKPWNTSFSSAVLAAFALVAITSVWWRIIPEDRWVVLNAIFPSKRPPGRRARDLTPLGDVLPLVCAWAIGMAGDDRFEFRAGVLDGKLLRLRRAAGEHQQEDGGGECGVLYGLPSFHA
ncbi:hypothetical protein [uncultured Arthrobacter sp.]|uniref:hypothetical protein n=1 Tax=uncultured Arthrobacter sp. TaxID=114050 RepID=UPI0025DF570D|nr:hypothetical protein [uncultured Arthrobacter sp.]